MGLIPVLSPISIVQQKPDMRYVAAYLLAQLGGNDAPDADAIKNILSSVGIDADEEKLGLVISQLAGKDINEVMAEGKEKLASVPSGAGAAAPAAGGAAAEETKEEAKASSSEESGDDDMGFGLFD